MNEKYKHRAPAPWRAYDRGIGWEIHDATDKPINSGFRDTFSRADAELCAAAPDLLAEVERLRNRVAELEQLATDAYLQTDGGARLEPEQAPEFMSVAEANRRILARRCKV